MAYTVKLNESSPFLETGSGLNSTFQPMYGNPELEPSYFSWVVNQKPALRGAGLRGTKTAAKAVWGRQMGQAPGMKYTVQLDFKDGSKLASHDRKWVNFQLEVADALEHFKVSPMTKVAVTDLGLTRDFSKLRTSGAWSMNPSTVPRLDTVGFAPGEIPEEYKRVLRLVTEIYTEKWEPATVQQNNKSHSGILTNLYEKDKKVSKIVETVRTHGRKFAEAFVDVDGEWFVAKFGAYPVVKLTARWQLDTLGKKRAGHDYTGKPVVANKTVPVEYSNGKPMTAARQRTAYAIDGLVNAMMSGVWSGYRQVATHRYNLSWHTSSDEDMLGPIKKYGNYRLYDAANFDVSYSREEINIINDSVIGFTELGKRYNDRLGHLPLLVFSDIKGESGCYLFNNVEYAAGHQSGVCYVSDFNKIRGTAHWLYGLVVLGYIPSTWTDEKMREAFKTVLEHEDEQYALINQGDDTMALGRNEQDLDKWCSIVENFKFAIWEKDEGRKMIGKVIYQKRPGDPLKIIPDAVTLVEKLLINEHGMHSKHRPMASAGNRQRIHMLELLCPAGPDILRILNRISRKHFGDTLDNIYAQTAYMDVVDVGAGTKGSFDLASHNDATRQFILDPDIIYKNRIRIEDIDPAIFKAVNSTILPEDAAWIVRVMGLMHEDVHPELKLKPGDTDPDYKIKTHSELEKLYV